MDKNIDNLTGTESLDELEAKLEAIEEPEKVILAKSGQHTIP